MDFDIKVVPNKPHYKTILIYIYDTKKLSNDDVYLLTG
jgi:hypothetical protein